MLKRMMTIFATALLAGGLTLAAAQARGGGGHAGGMGGGFAGGHMGGGFAEPHVGRFDHRGTHYGYDSGSDASCDPYFAYPRPAYCYD